MKITIAYKPEEERDAGEALASLRQMYPRGKVHREKVCKNDRYPPVKHLYLTVKEPLEKPESPDGPGVSAPGGARGCRKRDEKRLTNTRERDKITADE